MIFLRVAYCAVFLVTSGCMTAPLITDEQNLSVAHVIRRVKCELHEAVAGNTKQRAWLLDWSAAVNLELTVKRTAQGSALADLTVPIATGTFGLILGGGLSEDGTTIATFKLSYRLDELVESDCNGAFADQRTDRRLAGELGLKEWMDRATRAMDESDTKRDGAHFKGLNYTVSFLLKLTGNVTPSWSIIRASGHRIGPKLPLSGEYSNTHKLDIVMTQNAKKPPALEVFVTNFPREIGTPSVTPKTFSTPDGKTQKDAGKPLTGTAKQTRPLAPRPRGVDPITQQKLDTLLLEQTLRTLQLPTR